ncbi:hypothetical protein M0R45_035551 [Rubus argutus]|uniref:Laccase n=1 Tax=Rubus argutus TaxID=59490 RepID=A0AAW1VV14_RUBAR
MVELFFCSVQGEMKYFYDFVVRESNFTKLCETKSMLVVNDRFPGPEIRVHRGDKIFVNVQNQGSYGLTIHWHGIMQPRNPWSDGPEYITQCPIQPGTNFTYEVILSKEEGTVWWHAHSDWTRASVHGAIVILPAVGTTFPFPEPDEDEVIVIASWYKGDLQARPGDLCPCSKETTYRRKVDYGKTYLVRIVNANIDADIFFAIAQHNLTVVGLDGAYIKPIDTTYIVITLDKRWMFCSKQISEITSRMFITTSMNSLYCEDPSSSDCETKQIAASVNNISWVNPSTDILQSYYRNISGLLNRFPGLSAFFITSQRNHTRLIEH